MSDLVITSSKRPYAFFPSTQRRKVTSMAYKIKRFTISIFIVITCQILAFLKCVLNFKNIVAILIIYFYHKAQSLGIPNNYSVFLDKWVSFINILFYHLFFIVDFSEPILSWWLYQVTGTVYRVCFYCTHCGVFWEMTDPHSGSHQSAR